MDRYHRNSHQIEIQLLWMSDTAYDICNTLMNILIKNEHSNIRICSEGCLIAGQWMIWTYFVAPINPAKSHDDNLVFTVNMLFLQNFEVCQLSVIGINKFSLKRWWLSEIIY